MPTVRIVLWMVVLVLVMISPGSLRADSPEVDAETAQLIERLGSDDAPTQSSAIEKLKDRELEVGAIPLLKAMAESDNRKGQQAAIQLLVHLARQENDLAKAARESLTQLSQSPKPQVAAGAAQALQVLEPVVAPPVPGVFLGRRQPLQMNLRVNGGRAAVETVMTSIVNGERQIQVKNKDRTIEIKDRDGKEIVMKVTETAGGKETTYTAKDVAELKQKHAEILSLYEKYTKQQRGLPPGLGLQLPGVAPGFNIPVPGGNTSEAHKQIESSLSRLAKVKTALEGLDKESFDKEQVKGLLDELDAAKKELFAAQAQLEQK